MARCGIVLFSVALAAAPVRPAAAQESGDEFPGSPAPAPTRSDLRGPADTLELLDNGRPNVLLTGYWPPTNEMLRPWSPNPAQNPIGWVGGDWEARGYNVYAFFPEFPGGTTANPKGNGDFEVDYQDTSADWWPLLERLRPIALITFSRANTTNGWELEGGNRTYTAAGWSPDYLAPTRPTAEMPLYYEPHLLERWSTLPMNAIVAAISAEVPALAAFISPIDDSKFLSNCIGYHGNWWHDLHAAPEDPLRNYAAGHVHVGRSVSTADGRLGTAVTLRVLLAHVDGQRPPLTDADADGTVEFTDALAALAALNGPDRPAAPETDPAEFARTDTNRDGDVDLADLSLWQGAYATR